MSSEAATHYASAASRRAAAALLAQGKKSCAGCKQVKPIQDFGIARRKNRTGGDGRTSRCKDCRNAKNRQDREDLREAVLNGYGHRCSCLGCRVTQSVYLAIDHVDGGGRKQRLEISNYRLFYLTIIRAGFPSRYQLLCHNCNHAKEFGGCPPHDQ